MTSVNNKLLRPGWLAALVAGSLALAQNALAVGTAAGTSIANKATVNYTVGAQAQTPIESSPTGNTTAGVGNGTNTTFLVDNKVNLTVTELTGASISINPGQTGVVSAFKVSNTGNAPQAYQLAASNLTGTTLYGNTDNTDVTIANVFVDANGNNLYEAGTDTATSITTLAADASITVFVVVNGPSTLANGQFANVRLIATTAVNNTPATVLTQNSGSADTPGAIDVVFADGQGTNSETVAPDGKYSTDTQFAVKSAALTVQKTSTVISDPFSGTTNPKAIPAAVLEYSIVLTNAGALSATGIAIADPLPANTTFLQNAYNAGTKDVSITVGATTTFCTAEAGGTDTNADGCVRTAGGSLQITNPALSTVATGAANAVTVKFRVTVN